MCNCIEKVNATLLEQKNAELVVSISLFNPKPPPMVALQVVRTDTYKPAKGFTLWATYCPFCGEKYEPEATN